VLVSAVLAMRDGSRRSWIETARAFSTEALTFSDGGRTKPASQAQGAAARVNCPREAQPCEPVFFAWLAGFEFGLRRKR